ncbi:MAG: Uncharacterised protein [Methanobacteriota archaeon]|nr:MAG: Uncharacterised protein [Euryarchaeota archaeon]
MVTKARVAIAANQIALSALSPGEATTTRIRTSPIIPIPFDAVASIPATGLFAPA